MSTDAVVYKPPVARSHSWSDWTGCIFFLALAIFLILRTPRGAWMIMPAIFYDAVVSITFLIRRPALRSDSSWAARAAAYLGTFLVPAYTQLAGAWAPESLSPSSASLARIGTTVWVIGLVFVIWTVWQLRFAFSLVPQARVLQTSGPYKWVRHPIYAGYAIMYFAYGVAYLHLSFVMILLLWIGVTLVRIHYEEKVLRATFPGYAEYQASVGMLWPGRSW